jgi:hypothetical protein
MHTSLGDSINGPSLIRVPDWVPNPLGRYYLYFAHHQGSYIRMAYADQVEGPYRIHAPGTLRLDATPFHGHIASPDVHVDEARREIRMYYHGPHARGGQWTAVARSKDGLNFESGTELFGPSYFRVFTWNGGHYALAMPGIFYRSRDGLTGFEPGPTLFGDEQRHTALLLRGGELTVLYTNAGDCPERILASRIRLTEDWNAWRISPPETLLEPETDWEGANEALLPSKRGSVHSLVRQLRDPCVYEEEGKTWLVYAAGGEHSLAMARLEL